VSVERRLQSVVNRAGRDRQLAGIVASVERPATGLAWTGAHGEGATDTEFFVASTAKLHTTAIVLRLAERGALRLDDRVVELLGSRVDRLHVRDGVDRTGDVTIRHLLSQTSGLADYFQGRPGGGQSLERTIVSGADRGWTADEAIEMARGIGAAFAPGEGRRALYSDTNFQLLGLVIEEVLGVPYETALRREVVEPLGLTRTRLYTGPADTSPLPLRYGDRVLPIPRAMASFGADGGIVSTAGELMTFLRAFFEGGLFDRAVVETLQDYRRIFFPLQYGVGISRFAMPRLLGGTELIGHSGLSGAFAFLAPAQGVYVTGTVNNIAKPSRSFRLMQRLVRAAQ
jgi:CubicO group peptidase (beta-lactamase class C family)